VRLRVCKGQQLGGLRRGHRHYSDGLAAEANPISVRAQAHNKVLAQNDSAATIGGVTEALLSQLVLSCCQVLGGEIVGVAVGPDVGTTVGLSVRVLVAAHQLVMLLAVVCHQN
jgi:hypothetical protein